MVLKLRRCFTYPKTIPNLPYLTFIAFRMLKKTLYRKTKIWIFGIFPDFGTPKKNPFLRFFCQNVNFLTFSHHTAKKKCEKSKIFLEKVFSCDIPPGNQISWSYHHYRSTEKRYPKKNRFSVFSAKVKILAEI